MLILAKAVLSVMIGFLASLFLGVILVPLLRKRHIEQRVSVYLSEAHKKKDGTPTMGGLIFILGAFISIITLLLLNKMEFSPNLFILLFVFVGYALIGFLDDFLAIKRGTNEGLTTLQKLFLQIIIAVVFFFIYMKMGNSLNVEIYTLGVNINMGWFYGLFILFILLGGANAVNLTDGLDGLAGGLSAIAFLALGIIAWGSGWVEGYQDIAIFCFVLVGALIGFLLFNVYPAKIIMGDTGSLALGAAMVTVAILTDHELTIIVIMGVFIIKTLSVIIQNIWLYLFHKKAFLMTPLHHHFEKLGWSERDIVKAFWVAGFLLCMASIAFGVWI
ncbi:MAG TPA: phospho-N-acetylmuramoyl-pentapeptide-transferase [Bacilli bacterium]|nr:phospho-N-acetylmuramoyl-pentapeptide-transferase [Bacilli bacterium]